MIFMKVKIDQEKCIGCGTCISIVPEIFKFNADNKAELVDGADLTEHKEKINQAKDACPVQAISVE